ncbi:YdcF family protein [Paraburkholderia sp. D15]|uniref:YdcF family protein n=1 Tax=Paraburkholderia sp. D15 TaxID=2880218 RepID=UPI002479B02F|nr:YdcF family protein [Paraburkholderia sp. D15]WGS49958.1 YdcF family protein [Paraburkholderia sp. D15]
MLTSLLKWAVGLWLAAALIVACAGLLARPRQADLAIVYGNKVHADGSPSARLSARLDAARECYAKGLCREIMVSGGIDKHGTDEALAMKRDLMRQGVPENRIVMDNKGLDTWDTARNASVYMKAHNLRSAIAVSQYFHVPRAIIALKRFGVDEVSGTYPAFFERRDIYSSLREVPGALWYCVRRDF